MEDTDRAFDVDPFAGLEARLDAEYDSDLAELDYARTDDEAKAELDETMARLRERAANPPPEPKPLEEPQSNDLADDSQSGREVTSGAGRANSLRIIEEDPDLDTSGDQGQSTAEPQRRAMVEPESGGAFSGLVDSEPDSSDDDASDDDANDAGANDAGANDAGANDAGASDADVSEALAAEVDAPDQLPDADGESLSIWDDKSDYFAVSERTPTATEFDDPLDLSFADEEDAAPVSGAAGLTASADTANQDDDDATESGSFSRAAAAEATSETIDEPSVEAPARRSRKKSTSERLVPGTTVPTTRLATPEQMKASDALPTLHMKVSDSDPALPGIRVPNQRDTTPGATSGSESADASQITELDDIGEVSDTVHIPDRERPPVLVYLLLTALTLAALGALLWYTNRNNDSVVSTEVPASSQQSAADGDAPTDPSTGADATGPQRMDEAIPLISADVNRCDKHGLLGTIQSSASSAVQLDLRLQFLGPNEVVMYEAERATGAVQPSQAVTFTFLLLGEPVPEEFAGVDPVSCRLEVTSAYGA